MFCSRPISIFLHQIACGFLAFFCVRGGQLEAKASLTDLKGQIAVSIIVNVIILAAGIFAGAQVLQQLPEIVVNALQLLLPALVGAIVKSPRQSRGLETR